jgi:formate hydrogenlyase transcriptional activator
MSDRNCISPPRSRGIRRRSIQEYDDLIGRSAALENVLQMIDRVAPTDTTVLITGETGTGKELTARTLHCRSRRAHGPFVAVNLATIPESLVAAELFGHEPGAFTGALQRRAGRLETAAGGTLFMDEVGEVSPDVQVALLRVLQEGEFERLGSSQTRQADVRLIAATNRDLAHAVHEGRFRSDLYYRLNVFPIHLPALRERREDIPAIAENYLSQSADRLGRRFEGIEPASLNRLVGYNWPGNIRELQNVLDRSMILCDEALLCVPPDLTVEKVSAQKDESSLGSALRTNEAKLIEDALQSAEGRVAGANGAAARLGVPASTLESKIRRLRIDKLRFRIRRRA